MIQSRVENHLGKRHIDDFTHIRDVQASMSSPFLFTAASAQTHTIPLRHAHVLWNQCESDSCRDVLMHRLRMSLSVIYTTLLWASCCWETLSPHLLTLVEDVGGTTAGRNGRMSHKKQQHLQKQNSVWCSLTIRGRLLRKCRKDVVEKGWRSNRLQSLAVISPSEPLNAPILLLLLLLLKARCHRAAHHP